MPAASGPAVPTGSAGPSPAVILAAAANGGCRTRRQNARSRGQQAAGRAVDAQPLVPARPALLGRLWVSVQFGGGGNGVRARDGALADGLALGRSTWGGGRTRVRGSVAQVSPNAKAACDQESARKHFGRSRSPRAVHISDGANIAGPRRPDVSRCPNFVASGRRCPVPSKLAQPPRRRCDGLRTYLASNGDSRTGVPPRLAAPRQTGPLSRSMMIEAALAGLRVRQRGFAAAPTSQRHAPCLWWRSAVRSRRIPRCPWRSRPGGGPGRSCKRWRTEPGG